LNTYRCGRPHGEMCMAKWYMFLVFWRHPTIVATIVRVTSPLYSEDGNLLIDSHIDRRDIVLAGNLTSC
jgi:hypothetical protein